MTEEQRGIYHLAMKSLKLIGAAGMAAAVIAVALTFFAKSSTVRKLDHRIGLSISQDNIDRENADVRWMEQQTAFERRKDPKTISEVEIIKAAKTKLTESKNRHDTRVRAYEEEYGEKAQL